MPPIACPRGAYSLNISNFCTDCATTLTHATTLNDTTRSRADGVCDLGFYHDDALEGKSKCGVCDEGTSDCRVPGITLHSLRLLEGDWGVAAWSVELRRCPFPGVCVHGRL